jgi:glycine betaine/choline ABC-type transport system substrate-binding protein
LFGGVALLAVLCGGFVAGLGTGVSATAGTRTTTTLAATASSGTTTSSTLTQPKVTALPTTTTTPASALPGYNRPQIVVGDMNTPEQFVLGALYQVALEHAGYTVDITRNIGPYYLAQQALEQGSLDIYPDYLDSNLLPSWDRTVARLTRHFRSVGDAYAAGRYYAKRRGFELLPPTPGGDTLGLAVTSQFARENRVSSMAQLARVPLLTFGMPLGFGGLWRAEKAYKFKAGVVQYGATGDQYSALNTGSVQVAYADSSDPQLGEHDYVLLADPKHVYGFGNIVPVTTPKVVRREGPAFLRIINRIDALLTTRALRGLNAEVQLMHKDQIDVAEQFLEGNGLLPPVAYQVAQQG